MVDPKPEEDDREKRIDRGLKLVEERRYRVYKINVSLLVLMTQDRQLSFRHVHHPHVPDDAISLGVFMQVNQEDPESSIIVFCIGHESFPVHARPPKDDWRNAEPIVWEMMVSNPGGAHAFIERAEAREDVEDVRQALKDQRTDPPPKKDPDRDGLLGLPPDEPGDPFGLFKK